MRRTSIEIAGIVLCWGAAASVQAQPPHPPGPGHAAKPPATVVARVNVNVETDVDVGPADAAQKHDDEDEDEKDEAGSEAGKKADLSELVASVLKQAGPNAGIQVIADININVETSVKVRCLPPKAGASPAANAVMASPRNAEAKESAPNQRPEANTPPRKKKGRKKNRKPAEAPAVAAPAAPDDARTGLTLNKLKIGDRLELGVSSQLDSEQQARRIADQINMGRNRTLLGLAVAGGFIPEQADSMSVVQKAIASVNAESTGNEVSVSVAIPKETPGAIKSLVEAAMRR